MKKIYFILLLIISTSCIKGKKVDFIFHNTLINSCDESNHTYEAMAIHNGNIIELGAERQILNKYRSEEDEDLGSKYIYPTFVDANFPLFEILLHRYAIQTKNTDNENHFIYLIEKKLEVTNSPLIVLNSEKFNFEKTIQLIHDHFPKKNFYLLNQKSFIKIENSANKHLNQSEKLKLLTSLFSKNFNQFKSLFIEIQNELIEHGFNNVLIHDCKKYEYEFLKKINHHILVNFHLYLNFHNKISSTKKLHNNGFFLNENNKSQLQQFLNENKPLSFSSTFYKLNANTIKKNITTINQDHRWTCIIESKLTQNEVDELNELNIYPIINATSTNQIVNNFLACYGSSNVDPFEMNYKYIKLKNQSEIQKLKTLFTNGQKIIFQDNKLGVIEKNKPANFIILKNELDKVNSLDQLYIERLYLKNKLIYQID